MTTCATCGSHLSRDYLRVCGDNDGTVRDCPHCVATRRAESRRTPVDGSGSGTDGGDTDSSKMVLTAETNTDRDGKPGRSKATARTGDGRQDGRRRVRSGGFAGESSDGESASRPSVLSSVFDALR